MLSINKKKITEDLIDTFLTAGDLSLSLRKKGLTKNIKSDNTPVSNGDIEVNKLITKKILKLTQNIPIISEETPNNKTKENLKDFWLIDPIDGTSDYINDGEEFTINAALIENKKPSIGLICAPAKKRMFYSYGPEKSFELKNGKEFNLNHYQTDNSRPLKFLSYSNELKPEIEKIHKKLGVKSYTKMRSSYKFCVIAAGEFDGYVAEPRACEWDIAAGHAILEHAGGEIKDFFGNDILYGKKDFLNTSIILKNKKII